MRTDASIQTQTPLVDALRRYKSEEILSFDVPGHKKTGKLTTLSSLFGPELLSLDANSMKQLDILSNPTGVIKQAEDLYAALYQYDEAYFLVNGATVGVQAMILATCRPGDKILVPRNVHKSVLSALILAAAEPIYIYPEIHPEMGIATTVSFKAVQAAIDAHPEARTLLMVHPSYYGICCELEKVVTYAHQKEMTVIVDEAHGAHLPFCEELPINARDAGADMSTISVHKTGGALTQSAVLLIDTQRVDASRVKSVLNMLQSTSASYVLMASLDAARHELALNGERYLREALALARYAREELPPGLTAPGRELRAFEEVEDVDETKLVINTTGVGLTGFEFYALMRDEHNIQLELADACNAMAVLTIGDSESGVTRLIEAAHAIVDRHQKAPLSISPRYFNSPELVLSPRDVFNAHSHAVPLAEAVGQISAEVVTLYPPGIPLLMPGERITQDTIDYLRLLKEENGLLVDLGDPTAERIKVL